jgi:putative hemolysin
MSKKSLAALVGVILTAGAAGSSAVSAYPLQDTIVFGAEIRPVVQIKSKLAQAGSTVKGQIKPNGTVNLSSSDCNNVGGKVITVTDDRCGASKQYCRMPDTNAVCIDKVN